MKRRLLSVLLGAGALWAEAPMPLAIHNARIVPVNGPAIAKGTIVLRNGLIESVGADVNVPADAWVLEGEGSNCLSGIDRRPQHHRFAGSSAASACAARRASRNASASRASHATGFNRAARPRP